MKKLFEDVRNLDEEAVKKGVSSEILMENAALALANLVRKKIKKGKLIVGICGSGNNAADTLATLRILSGEYECVAFFATDKKSDILKKQLYIAKNCGVKTVNDLKDIRSAKCVIDGILGSGLNKNLDAEIIKIIDYINELQCLKIACDLPSGLRLDGNGAGAVFKADFTVTMGALKTTLYSDFAKDFTGKIKVASLGLSSKFYEGESDYFKLDKSDMKLPFRKKRNVNKGDFGHVFVVAGRMGGAARIAALAALNIGAGLVSVIGKAKNLESLLMGSDSINDKMKFGAVGMGLGKLSEDKKAFFFEILKHKSGLVIDADLCYEPLTIELLRANENTVLTPHPKEFASLLHLAGLGKFSAEDVQKNRFGLAKIWSEKFKSVLLLKGANTLISKGGKVYVMPYGSAALAKGGSGDALSGIIVGLLAQGYESLDAAMTGSLAHALSVKKSKKNNYAISAEDIIKRLKWLKK